MPGYQLLERVSWQCQGHACSISVFPKLPTSPLKTATSATSASQESHGKTVAIIRFCLYVIGNFGNFGNFGKFGKLSATSASYRQLRQVCGHGRLHVSWGGRLRSAAPFLEPGSGDPEGFDVRLAVGVVGFMAAPLSSTMEAVTQEPSKVRPAAPPVTCVVRCVRCAPCDWCLVRRVAVWCV